MSYALRVYRRLLEIRELLIDIHDLLVSIDTEGRFR